MTASRIREVLEALLNGQDLARESMEELMHAILRGQVTIAQLAGISVALRIKGETSTELAAAARVMRQHGVQVSLKTPGPLLDTAGTGGDGVGSFNLSTAAALVAAACGITVAKHGNRAVSSRSGSADFLEALGVRLEVPPAQLQTSIETAGIAFLHAPAHHQALRHAAPMRRDLGVRTFFNLLGPLSNPARASHQLVGVYDASRTRQMAEVLQMLGLVRAWVVHGFGGLDEVSPSGPTQIAELSEGQIRQFTCVPEDFGLETKPIEILRGGDAAWNASLMHRLAEGEDVEVRPAVLLNAAAALVVARPELEWKDATALAQQALDDGSVLRTLQRWVSCTNAARDFS
ncbi:MAG: anthranilate phosphoribosyltransferase [Myxococcota bacterium]